MNIEDIKSRLEKHSKPSHNEHGCIEWIGCVTNGGYGRIGINGKVFLAHRVSAFIAGKIKNIRFGGDFFAKDLVCHTCDNTKCINPDHLFLANHTDNMVDKNNKNRVAILPGELNPNCKTTEKEVLAIRFYRMNKLTVPQISKLMNIGESRLYGIASGKSFKGEQYAVV